MQQGLTINNCSHWTQVASSQHPSVQRILGWTKAANQSARYNDAPVVVVFVVVVGVNGWSMSGTKRLPEPEITKQNTGSQINTFTAINQYRTAKMAPYIIGSCEKQLLKNGTDICTHEKMTLWNTFYCTSLANNPITTPRYNWKHGTWILTFFYRTTNCKLAEQRPSSRTSKSM